MTEGDAVERTDRPVTVERLADDLRALGVDGERPLLVHASLSSLGWVAGGAQAVVEALLAATGEAATVAVPTHSTQLSDPADWQNPPVPESWYDELRESMPAFRPETTPTRGMGAVVDCFRADPAAVRSRHPTHSMAARGPDAEAVVGDHALAFPLGEGSPLARLYERDARVLLLGVGHDRNTSLHLAEHRAERDPGTTTGGGPVRVDGERAWREFEELRTDTADFPEMGAAFERERPGAATTGPVGEGTARLLDQRALVDFAADWIDEHR